MKTFKHSGDLGDIIYSLTTIKDLGGGILYLDTSGGVGDEYCERQLAGVWDGKTKFNKKGFDFLYPLLKKQSYISDVRIYNGEKIDYNLNKFRHQILSSPRISHGCVLDCHREPFSLPIYDVNKPWIDCGDPIILKKNIVISRSPRYQGAYTWLAANRKILEKFGVFIGVKKEHELFEWTFEVKIDFYPSDSALDVAKIISGAKTLISNSTFNLAIGMSLNNTHIIQEMDKSCLLTLFPDKQSMERI